MQLPRKGRLAIILGLAFLLTRDASADTVRLVNGAAAQVTSPALRSYTGQVGLTCNSTSTSASNCALSKVNVNGALNPATFTGTTDDVQITNAEAALPAAGGTIDESSVTTATFTGTVVLNKPTHLTWAQTTNFTVAANTTGLLQFAAGSGGSVIECPSYYDAGGNVKGCVINLLPGSGTNMPFVTFPSTLTQAQNITFRNFTVVTNTAVGDIFANSANVLVHITWDHVQVLPTGYAGNVIAPASFAGAQGFFFENTGNPASSEVDFLKFDSVKNLGTKFGISVAGANVTTVSNTVIANILSDGIAGGIQGSHVIIGTPTNPGQNTLITNSDLFRGNLGATSSALQVYGSGQIVNSSFSQNNFRNIASPNSIGDISVCDSLNAITIAGNQLLGGLPSGGTTPFTDPDNGVADCSDGTTLAAGNVDHINMIGNTLKSYFVSGTHFTNTTFPVLYLSNNWSKGSGSSSVETDGSTPAASALNLIGPIVVPVNLLTYGTTVTPDLTKGDLQFVTVTDGVAWTLANPSGAQPGARWMMDILNSSGGVGGAITLGANYKSDGTLAAPANTKRKRCVAVNETATVILLGNCTADM